MRIAHRGNSMALCVTVRGGEQDIRDAECA